MRSHLLVLLAAAALILAAPVASAEDTPGKIELRAKTEPAELAPGGSGTLIVEGIIGDKLHVYATDRGGQSPLSWKPIEVEGVTYDIKKAKITPYKEKVDETFGDAYDVWTERVEIRVPVTVAKSVAGGTEIGLLLSYNACTAELCWPPQKDDPAKVKLAGSGESASNGGGETATPPVAADPGGKAKRQYKSEDSGSGGGAKVELNKDKSAVIVTFLPEFGHKLSRPAKPGETPDGLPVEIKPVEADGITWGKFEIEPGGAETDPFSVEVPITIEREGGEAVLEVKWQACNDMGQCLRPDGAKLSVLLPGVAKTGDGPQVGDPQGPAENGADTGKVIFEVVEGDDISAAKDDFVQTFYANHGLLVLAVVFGLGVLLAFTPCVLPIIPITVAVVTGGRTDLPKKRLLALLTTYVIAMACTFGAVGVIAAVAGGSMSAAFQIPGVIWGIAALFTVLAFGMLGVIELQPPQWMTKMQGSAQQKGGSILGAALLGALMALVASPCTGPFIVGMSVLTASTGSVPFGFFLFASMGLGMGAVMFAFGALNFALRPGPWMVWVRYGFGMLLFGGALYYVANSQLLMSPALWIVGAAVAALAAYLVARHLIKAEGEEASRARNRGLKVAGMFVAATLLVGWITHIPPLPENVDPKLVAFEKLDSIDQLREVVADGVSNDRPTVIDVWATWCAKCKVYERYIKEDDELRHEFSKLRRLKIDVTEDNFEDLRDALGIPRTIQPFFVFIDKEGRIRRAADIDRWYEGEDGGKVPSKKALMERLELVLGDEFGPGKGRPYAVETAKR